MPSLEDGCGPAHDRLVEVGLVDHAKLMLDFAAGKYVLKSELPEPTEEQYWEAIKDVVEEVRDRVLEDSMDPYEASWEILDSHQYVIYTVMAQRVLVISPNDGAGPDEFGAEIMVEDGALQWSRLAFAAMLVDVREHDDWGSWENHHDEEGDDDEG